MSTQTTEVSSPDGDHPTSQKVPLAALVALVIGSMIGGGIFSLPIRWPAPQRRAR